ncbi:uncharacterized protein LOC116197833 [Punica granatum]|uniref:DC1 domain-containing protein n=2 Tax=Punica granatum TaxID=22663 RepID=A0A218X299_PUNGR|nr:uncharacterized protein LOC116197833 [Punica granatum]OWM78780.1 hypothetical protein CDL15_Pgr002951 [Punica granatum]PKI31338.1 hypothetical protein CRG98_048264 [Punica granatum]
MRGERINSSCAHKRALASEFKDNLVGMVIAVKGGPCSGKTTLARALAKSFRCTLLSHDDILSCTSDTPRLPSTCPSSSSSPTSHLNDLSYEVLWRVAETQLCRQHNVIIDSPLQAQAHLDRLLALTSSEKNEIMPIIIECWPRDKSEWRRRLGKTYSPEETERTILEDEDCDTSDIPKLTIDTTSPLGIEEHVTNMENFILSCLDKKLYGEMAIGQASWGCTQCKMAYVRKLTAGLPKSLKHQCYEHELALITCERIYAFGKTSFFPCTGCGGEGENVHYSCTNDSCEFWLHVKCALNLPLTINPEFHWHPLVLTPRPLIPEGCWCDFCEERRHPDVWIYFCEKCEYHVHVGCANPEFYQSPDLVSLPLFL